MNCRDWILIAIAAIALMSCELQFTTEAVPKTETEMSLPTCTPMHFVRGGVPCVTPKQPSTPT